METGELNLQNRYFNWLCRLGADSQHPGSYMRLLRRLHEIDFTYTIPMDGNRVEDGINLRYRFGRENGCSDAVVACLLDRKPCSVLEMMVALAVRCEEHIMNDPDIGDRTGIWFWIMLENLELGGMTDARYRQHIVDNRIARFLERDYAPDGAGGLFVVKHCPEDMRTVDIWYQLMWYLDEIV